VKIKSKFPCCDHAITLECSTVATDVRRRTCKRCDIAWQVITKPLVHKGGLTIHEWSWISLTNY